MCVCVLNFVSVGECMVWELPYILKILIFEVFGFMGMTQALIKVKFDVEEHNIDSVFLLIDEGNG